MLTPHICNGPDFSAPRRLRALFAVVLAVFGLAVPALVAAQPSAAAPVAVPPQLQPWVPWVLSQHPELRCPLIADQAVCLWPGELKLELDARGGGFEQQLASDRELGVALPGSEAQWPRGVTVDGKPAVVLQREGRPFVWMAAGVHRVAGRFAWKKLPEVLRLPPRTALVALRVDGNEVPRPRREGEELWLASGQQAGGDGESLELSVQRHIADGVPLRITTRVELRAGGRAREVDLGVVTLAGSRPTSLSADLPARLDKNGRLEVQVRAGRFEVRIESLQPRPPSQLRALEKDGPWPEREHWVFQADDSARQVALGGAPGVDPARTDLPEAWRALPAFALGRGQALHMKTLRRGEPEPPPNQLSLQRDLWLDLDGSGFTVRDRIEGELNQGFRLDLRGGELGHVAQNGRDLLITRSADGKARGVELREGRLSLTAEWRGKGTPRSLSAVGWSQDLHSLHTVLRLPPGWTLLSARGVDKAETWIGRWDLMDFFLALIVALAFGKLLGLGWGLLGLCVMVLSMHERDAPVSIWLPLLALLALLRALEAGRVRRVTWGLFGAAVFGFAAVALPFSVDQLRTAMHPQLGLGRDRGGADGFLRTQMAPAEPVRMAATPMAEEPAQDVRLEDESDAAESEAPEDAAPGRVGRKRQVPSSLSLDRSGYSGGLAKGWLGSSMEQDPNAVVQTGPGVPTWNWRAEHLRWSGPVQHDQRMSLQLISPPLNRLLNVLRVALLLVLAFGLLRAARATQTGPGTTAPGAAAVAVALLLALSWGLAAAPAQADVPGRELLDELGRRLVQGAECRPDCLSIASLELSLGADTRQLTMGIEAHAGEAVGLPLPGPAANWLPDRLLVDGRPSSAMALMEDGFIYVRLEPGRHRLELSGPIPDSDALTLSFAQAPLDVSAELSGYRVDGIREDGRPGASIQLSRLLEEQGEQRLEGTALPPFFELTRLLEIGTSWKLRSTLRRVSPVGAPAVVGLAPLPGEAITEEGFELDERGQLLLAFGGDESERSWTSTLDKRPELLLRAAEQQPFSELWVLRCGSIWHCQAEGIAPIAHQQEGRWEPHFRPWPGESLKLSFRKPSGVEGQSTTVDSAELDVRPGLRITDARLTLHVRSSVGGVHSLTLPEGARVQSLLLDGRDRAIRHSGRKLSFNLATGAQRVELHWQQPQRPGLLQRLPRVDLGAGAANATLRYQVPDERWLLWVRGPNWGPAILFWVYLLIIAVGSTLLARVADSPLSRAQWFILSLGLTQIPFLALSAIVGWFFAMARRARSQPQSVGWHNLVQVGLIMWSVAALGALYAAIHMGLLVQPDMQVQGAGSDGQSLVWFVDDVAGTLPQPQIFSVNIWVWRIAMLLWALWLANRLLSWMPWAWRCFGVGGRFRSNPKPAVARVGAFGASPVQPSVVEKRAEAGAEAPSGDQAAAPVEQEVADGSDDSGESDDSKSSE